MAIYSAKWQKYFCESCRLAVGGQVEWQHEAFIPLTCQSCYQPATPDHQIRRGRSAQVSDGETAVVYRDPATGHIRYPATNAIDDPIGQKAIATGYERVEFKHTSDLDTFARRTGVSNEAVHGERE